jgi:hypothetical protein
MEPFSPYGFSAHARAESPKNQAFQLKREPIPHRGELLEVYHLSRRKTTGVGPTRKQGFKPIRRE